MNARFDFFPPAVSTRFENCRTGNGIKVTELAAANSATKCLSTYGDDY